MVTEDEIRYLEQLENELEETQRNQRKLSNAQMSLFGVQDNENLIKWQLDLREELNRLYHLLRGDEAKEDEKGNIIYFEPKDDNLKPFNEFGVQLIMNIMSFYINKNTILSNYNEETINWKIHDFGLEIVDLIFNRYEEMGMNTLEKRKMYPIIIRELVDSVHSSYLRALNGGERASLREARTVMQSEPLIKMPNYPMVGQQKQTKIWNPTTWFK